MKLTHWLIACSAIACMTSCDPNRLYEQNQTIEGDAWDQNDIKTFNIDIPDTVQPYNVFINIREATGYPFSNLFLFVTTTFPNQKALTDTVEIMLKDQSGESMGSGLGDIWDHQVMWKHAVRFPQAGTYRISLQQAMRVEKLPLIMDVGIRVAKFENE